MCFCSEAYKENKETKKLLFFFLDIIPKPKAQLTPNAYGTTLS